MISLLAKWFIRDRENMGDAKVRRAYGQLCGFVGIALNVLLFAGKFFAGTLSGSIAITADAFNNLSDAGSSVVTLLGFRLAGRKPDPEHPFGHGRMEYISGLVVSALILLMGVELAKSSFDKTGKLVFFIKPFFLINGECPTFKCSSEAPVATALFKNCIISNSFSDTKTP